jgi:hypothetical protein
MWSQVSAWREWGAGPFKGALSALTAHVQRRAAGHSSTAPRITTGTEGRSNSQMNRP